MVDPADIAAGEDPKYIVDDTCNRYCTYAVVNDQAINLRPRLPQGAESIASVKVYINDVLQTSSNQITQNIPILFQLLAATTFN